MPKNVENEESRVCKEATKNVERLEEAVKMK